jgi:hypothetical protein
MKHHSIILSALALASTAAAYAVPVTFQVDMSYQAAQGLFDPSTQQVEARGAFNNWSGGFALAPTATNATVYSGTTDVAGSAGSSVEYKFVTLTGGNANWESIGNRSFTLASAAQTLPTAYFNNQWDGAPLNVTFQINMATQEAAHAFDPTAGDVVELRGEFNGWAGGTVLEPDATNPDIYTITVPVSQAPGSSVQYKFHIQRAASDTWENDPNRQFAQLSTDQTLPVVYFNNVTGVPIRAALNFAVDMNAQIAGGKFDGTSEEVWVRGNKMGWDVPPQGLQLFEDAGHAGVYTNQYQMDAVITGDTIEYKYTIFDPSTGGTTWEDGANKSVAFTGTESTDANGYHVKTLATTYFNGISPADILSADTLVTFQVDMNGAVTFGGATPFDAANSGVWINASFVNNGNWGAWGSQDPSLQMFDDGVTGGDTVAGDGIYSFQAMFPKGSPTLVTYKYGIDSADNEAAANNNHVRYIRATGSYTMPLDKFGMQTQETQGATDLGNVSIKLESDGKITLTWPGQAGVKLQQFNDIANAASGTDVPNSDGQSSVTLTPSAATGFFRIVKP